MKPRRSAGLIVLLKLPTAAAPVPHDREAPEPGPRVLSVQFVE